jgi:hypothetical protein
MSNDSTNDHILKAYSVLPVWSRMYHVKKAAFRWDTRTGCCRRLRIAEICRY